MKRNDFGLVAHAIHTYLFIYGKQSRVESSRKIFLEPDRYGSMQGMEM